MANRLKNLLITKVALCPKGQNPDAHIVLFKSDEGTSGSPKMLSVEAVETFVNERLVPLVKAMAAVPAIAKDTFSQIRADRQRYEAAMAAWSEVTKSLDDLRMALATSILWDTPNVPEALKSIDQFGDAVDGVLRSLSKEDTNMAAKKDYSKMKPEELVAELEARDTAAAGEKSPTLTKEDTDALPEPVRKALEAQAAELAKAKEQTDKLAADLQKAADEARVEKEKREKLEAIAKGKVEFKHLPLTDEEKGDLVLQMAKMSEAQATAFRKALAAGNTALQSVTKEEGQDGGGETSAKAQLDALTKEAMKSEPTLTFAQAYDRVCTAHADLYKEARLEA